MSELTNLEKRILYERFKNDKTLQDIGNELGVSRERIRQNIAKILHKTKNKHIEILNTLINENHDFSDLSKVCVFCKKPFSGKGYKFCDKCRVIKPVNTATKKYTAKKFKLPEYIPLGIGHIVKEESIILYECPCVSMTKYNHHFDYTNPNQVIRLCASCHKTWHNTLASHNFGHINNQYYLPGYMYNRIK